MGLREGQAEDQASQELAARNGVRLWELGPMVEGEEGGTRGVAVKCIDITKNPNCEGRLRARK